MQYPLKKLAQLPQQHRQQLPLRRQHRLRQQLLLRRQLRLPLRHRLRQLRQQLRPLAPGQAVAEGDILIILEAMKMENEILAPSAGTVDTVPVAVGASVNSGDVLVTLV